MSGYRQLARNDFLDDQGNRLAVILETNDRSWKVFARLYQNGGIASDSGWVNYPSEEGGRSGFDEVTNEAEKTGWIRE